MSGSVSDSEVKFLRATRHSRPGPAGRRSSHVRYAPKATVGHQNAIGRDGPKADSCTAANSRYRIIPSYLRPAAPLGIESKRAGASNAASHDCPPSRLKARSDVPGTKPRLDHRDGIHRRRCRRLRGLQQVDGRGTTQDRSRYEEQPSPAG